MRARTYTLTDADYRAMFRARTRRRAHLREAADLAWQAAFVLAALASVVGMVLYGLEVVKGGWTWLSVP